MKSLYVMIFLSTNAGGYEMEIFKYLSTPWGSLGEKGIIIKDTEENNLVVKYDDDNEGLKQTQESLASEKGRKGIDLFLKEVIQNDERPEMIRQAKKLRIELLNPVAQQGSMASYLHQIQTTPQQQKKTSTSAKKQKEIK